MANKTYDEFGLEQSQDVHTRNVKGMLWGPTGTWKSETVARNFPGLLLIDTEGNSDHLVNNPAIPPFLRKKTKDVRDVMKIFDAACAGKIKMPDGSPVLTFCLDSVSILWNVQTEVAATLAEKRAQRYNKPTDDALVTLQDWGKAKRPLKSLMTRFSNASIPFLILIAREKDLYEGEGQDLKKVGFTPDVVKGAEYDMNFIIHTGLQAGKWVGEVTKVQGKLGSVFPLGKKLTKFPIEELLAYAKEELHPSEGHMQDDIELAGQIVDEEMPRTKTALMEIGAGLQLSPADIAEILKSHNLTFDPNRWDEMVDALKKGKSNGVPA